MAVDTNNFITQQESPTQLRVGLLSFGILYGPVTQTTQNRHLSNFRPLKMAILRCLRSRLDLKSVICNNYHKKFLYYFSTILLTILKLFCIM